MRVLTELPRIVDRSTGSRPEDLVDEPAERRWAPLVAWLLLAATVVLWLRHLPQLPGGWTETALAGAVILAGFGLLRWIWRS